MGYEDQPDFLNAVARFESDQTPKEILAILQRIEKQLRKAPPFKNGPRTIDLDLLLHGDTVLETPALTIPHPGMHTRRFVLEPLCELIDPSAIHPVLKEPWGALLKGAMGQSCTRLNLIL